MSSLHGTAIGFDLLVVWWEVEGRRGGCGEVSRASVSRMQDVVVLRKLNT
jgi:hypothetical protein